MRIITKGDDYKVRLRIPTGLVFNRFTAAAISKEMGKYGVKISSGQARTLIKTLKNTVKPIRIGCWPKSTVPTANMCW